MLGLGICQTCFRGFLIYCTLLALAIFTTFTYLFSTIANFVAAPFNGLLAEQLEAKLTGKKLSDQSILSLLKDVPRILGREWRKLMYYLPKALGLFILLLIPALGQTIGTNTLVPIFCLDDGNTIL